MAVGASGPARYRIRVEGIVQGVGFRPFVYGLAASLGVRGHVGNDAAGVVVEAEGDPGTLGAFLDGLESRAPPLAVVERVRIERVSPTGCPGFAIVGSDGAGPRSALVPPDTATCDRCLADVLDPTDRRYGYPFTNCTACGPRFTIVTGVPYDRPSTTMASFALCDVCAGEYEDPLDRRFHAQPVCCPRCGPRLALITGDGEPVPGDPLTEAARWLAGGAVLAVKGLGGYHLAADAAAEDTVAALRCRKHREDKPFAVMAPDVEAVRELCDPSAAALAVLAGPRRPIVLLPRRPGAPVAPSVAPGNRDLGVMLPYTPLHHLLAGKLRRPFVLTSGNVSDEPIAYRDVDALGRLAGIADGFLVHDRPIHVRTDDSVVRIFRGRELPVRRSRGYVPEPLSLPEPLRRPVLACGAELKNTFCLARDRYAFVSQHIGDLENYETLRAFTAGIEHFQRLFDVRPEVVAHDLHPEYLSTKYALDTMETTGVETIGVQHHHAHVASCLADNMETGSVIGVAYDGLGYGTDGTIWGGELLVADLGGFRRAGHLEAVRMPGGAAAIREPWRMAAAYLLAAYGPQPPPDLAVVRRHGERWAPVLALAERRVNAPETSSAGRLFDAVAALIGVRDAVNYEGQAAIELEQRAALAEGRGYPARIDLGDPLVVRGTDLIRAVVDDLRAGQDPGVIAARFHNGLVAVTVRAVEALRERTGIGTVALSGGVFQNAVLLGRTAARLEARGLRVLVHRRVPPNDGGISLGQVAVAASADRARSADAG